MRVLLVNSLYAPHRVGGAEYSVQLLAEAMAHAGHDVSVLTAARAEGSAVAEINGVQVHYVGIHNLYWPFAPTGGDTGTGTGGLASVRRFVWHSRDTWNAAMARAVDPVLDAVAPHIVHTHNLAAFSVALWPHVKRRGIPIVHTPHDYYLLCPNSGMFRADLDTNCEEQCTRCRAFAAPRRLASRHVDGAFGISTFVLEEHLRRGYFPEATERSVVPVTDLPARPHLVRPAATAGRPLRFGFLGRIESAKGIDTLLEAFAGLAPEEAELVVAGAGERGHVGALRRRHPRPNVSFVGFVPAEEVYGRIDVAVVPSRWREPLGRVPLEAAAAGVPSVVSDVGGLPETIEDGRTGLLVRPGDAGALRAALRRLVADRGLVERLGRDALERVATRAASGPAETYLEVYGRLVPRSHRSGPRGAVGPVPAPARPVPAHAPAGDRACGD